MDYSGHYVVYVADANTHHFFECWEEAAEFADTAERCGLIAWDPDYVVDHYFLGLD